MVSSITPSITVQSPHVYFKPAIKIKDPAAIIRRIEVSSIMVDGGKSNTMMLFIGAVLAGNCEAISRLAEEAVVKPYLMTNEKNAIEFDQYPGLRSYIFSHLALFSESEEAVCLVISKIGIEYLKLSYRDIDPLFIKAVCNKIVFENEDIETGITEFLNIYKSTIINRKDYYTNLVERISIKKSKYYELLDFIITVAALKPLITDYLLPSEKRLKEIIMSNSVIF